MPNLLTPDLDIADNNLPSPSEDFSSYSQLTLHIAKVMDLDVPQPVPTESDKLVGVFVNSIWISALSRGLDSIERLLSIKGASEPEGGIRSLH